MRHHARAVLLCFFLAAHAQAAPDARFDPETGRDARNYAPDRAVDFLHMALAIDIPDMNAPAFTATQTLDIAALNLPVATIRLNAEQLNIKSVEPCADAATRLTHHYDGSTLTIVFDPPLEPGQQTQIVTTYALRDPVDGLFWTPESPDWPGRPAQLHSQGQPETNRFWFPCHDSPNERLTTELTVTVPDGFEVISNGSLEARRQDAGRTTFHWVQSKPHAAYLISMIVGKFDTVDVAPPSFDPNAPRLPVHVPPGKGPLVQQTYGRTADMIRLFERVFDEPYPWDRYAQAVVWNFGAGGMENTSATTLFDTAVLDEKALADGDLDGLIAHELCHQWTGDLITCNTWEHIWLNEGWATFGTALWFEQRDGRDAGYLRQMHSTMRALAREDTLDPDTDDFAPAMVSKVYEHPWDVFRRKADPYPKGASILHMLRMKLGDDAFFKGVAAYFDRYKLKTAETDDFRKVLEEVSGLSLERFFDQWCYRAGTPKLKITARWNAASKELTITTEQLQRIDADNPAFVLDLPIVAVLGNDAERAFVMHIDERRAVRTVALDRAPRFLRIDPDLRVLMDPHFDLPDAWILAAADDAKSLVTRLDAITALGARNDPASIDLLTRRLNDRDALWYERQLAADALGKLKATDALISALAAGIDDARPRAKALTALGLAEGNDAKARAAAVLMPHASDAAESYACRAAALEALGKVADNDNADALQTLRAALAAESQHDQVRVGAIKGLARLSTKAALEAVIPMTTPGHYSRTRPDAVNAIADLAHLDENRALDALEPLLLDPEARTRRAARQALARIENDRALAMLDSFIARTRHPVERDEANDLRKKLARKLRTDN